MPELTKILEEFRRLYSELEDSDKKAGVYEAYYDAKTIYENLEDLTKPTLAKCEINVMSSEKKKWTQAEITREAYNQEVYEKHLKALAFARDNMNQAYAKMKSFEARLDIIRSINKHVAEAEL